MRLLSHFVALSLARLSAAAIKNDFSAYPQGSQACLTSSADTSKCTGDTGTEMNQCLCTNQGNFIYNTAKCVAKASPSDLKTVYATLQNNCAGTGVTISVSEDAFMAQAASVQTTSSTTSTRASTSTSSTRATTTTATSSARSTITTSSASRTASSTDSDTASQTASSTSSAPTSTTTSAELTTGAKIGIGLGIGFGSLAVALGAAFIWVYSRRRREEGGGGKYMRTASPGGTEYTGAFGRPSPGGGGGHELGQMAWKPTPSPSPSAGGIYNPHDEPKPHVAQPLLAELGGGGGFPGMNEPVELPGTQGHPQPQYGQQGHLAPAQYAGAQYSGESNGTGLPGPHDSYSRYYPQYERSNF